jgi:recombination protein RecR
VKSYPPALVRLIAAFEDFPGIGEATAERLALHLLKQPPAYAASLSEAVSAARAQIRSCRVCFNVSEGELCPVCADTARDRTTVCVVEGPRELLAIERAGVFSGVFHCLLGRLAPAEGVREQDLTIDALRQRCGKGSVREVILATNPNLAGDATALAVAQALSGTSVVITRLARGIPAGHTIELLAGNVLEEGLLHRVAIGGSGRAATASANVAPQRGAQ